MKKLKIWASILPIIACFIAATIFDDEFLSSIYILKSAVVIALILTSFILLIKYYVGRRE